MEQLDLIEEVTRNDGSRYYEISNIDQNGIAELAADHGLIKKVKILQLNIPRTKALIAYEKYINDTYDLQTLTNESVDIINRLISLRFFQVTSDFREMFKM